MSQLAKQLIAEAKRTNAKVLDLGNCGLTELPDELFELTELEELNLCYSYLDYESNKWIGSQNKGKANQLNSLKTGIGNLATLKTLRINGDYKACFQISDYSFLEKLTSLQTLNLSNNQISDISFLEKLTSLQTLNLRGIQISDISFLEKLTCLQTLNLSSNQISDISFLEKLTSLQTLDLSYNQISDISFLEKLTSLQKLNLRFNQISDIAALEKLTSLQTLYLLNNQISDISFLEKLTSLQTLELSSNQISDISFLEKLTSLQTLELSSNQISDIAALEKLTSLQTLYLSYNQISDISFLEKLTTLQTIKISYNKISDISLSFLNNFPRLSSLWLYNNPLKNIDEAIIGDEYNNCLNDLRNFLIDLEEGKTSNNAIKLLLTGNGNVGKTQIAKRFVEKEKYVFNPAHDSTHGIHLLKPNNNLPCEAAENGLDLTLWDFGGQDLYHATHRMFMQTKAVFLLVWDAVSQTEPYHYINEKPYKNEKRQYWLEYINHFSDNSPIILVQNKVDKDTDESYNLPEPAQAAYKEKYKVKAILQVSAKTGRQFKTIENIIIKLFSTDEDLKATLLKELPNTWVAVRNRIYKDAAHHIKTIKLTDFENYCDKEGIKKSSHTLLKFLHNTGVLFYKEDYFNNKIIINQAWSIDAVYKVLDRESAYVDNIKTNKGLVDFYDIKTIWKDYTKKEWKLFIDFMLSCEICLETTPNKWHDTPLQDRTFIIPQFLPAKPATIEQYCGLYNIDETAIILKAYQFLPNIYIQRFIVRAGLFGVPKARWQNGVLVFYEAENAYALVEANYESNQITIQISPNCKQLLQVIKNELNKIEGEGKVRPKEGKQGYDEIAFAENLSFKNLKPNTTSMNEPKKVFISYSKEDVEEVEKKLVRDLKSLERQKKIDIFYDKKLLAGDEWDTEIKAQLQQADVILLVVSPDFIATDYIWDVEIEKAIERHNKGEAKVIPIILRPCDWVGNATPFSKLNAVPAKGKPISNFDNQDEAWLEVLQAIKKVIDEK